MNCEKVNIRDPFILPYEGVYYLYGTRSATCWGPADGFDCYTSADLVNWDGPFEIFHRPDGFFADRAYWAPECVRHGEYFYLVATLGGEGVKKGVYALRAPAPGGPFVPYSQRLTPEDWSCIDGTVFFEDGAPWLVFSHSFEDSPDGDMCALPLCEDLSAAAGEPVKLFSAHDAPWAKPVPFAKAEFGMDGDVYFTDGPFIHKGEDGKLYMPWSSWADRGYAVGVAVSGSGRLAGPWRQEEIPLFPADGGHGMLFESFDGKLLYALHYPNTKYEEHPVFSPVAVENGHLILKEDI